MDRSEKPWDDLRAILVEENREDLASYINGLSPGDTALAISRLTLAEQSRVMLLLNPADAADVIEDVSSKQATGLIEELSPSQAAAIVDEMRGDLQADLLGNLESTNAEAILQEMPHKEAKETRILLSYAPNSAGGLMTPEYLSFCEESLLSDVVKDFQVNRTRYAGYPVQYIYVVDREGRLTGVLRLHNLLFNAASSLLRDVMIKDPQHVRCDTNLRALRDFFSERKLFGVPVIDEERRLVGVVLPEDVEEAGRRQAVRQYLGFSGIIGGEEFRSMPLWLRSGRRLSWLSINIVLNILAASIIALYQNTLEAAITLAVFLPIISDMSGCSGNQAVAVSMRELNLGLLRHWELTRVLLKEASLGLINGLMLGLLLGGAAYLWKGNLFLGLVVGSALAANTLVSVSFGGLLPLLLKRMKLDPALVSGPMLTTVTDMCGFFFVLSFASAVLPRLS
ncbi:MAG: magnesium transporter [Planctomycetes bacterium]|nr:magnesium transporter [Planctomycetota bacterium]